MSRTPRIPVSWGELVDKITILEIKSERLGDVGARANVARELALLSEAAVLELSGNDAARDLKGKLRTVNEALWEIEDKIRQKEAQSAFDESFVALARSVYKRNDERAALKRQINALLSSELVEEKSYTSYG
ncbi:MAG TPA: DUF6165 family protein [Beijerinckiaceae bacterium]|jgi:Fic family protein|nr:DUF6165 family protein [Beijerinckiaceae bacterium]